MRSVRWGTVSLAVGLMKPMVDLPAALRAPPTTVNTATLTGEEQDVPYTSSNYGVSRPLTL